MRLALLRAAGFCVFSVFLAGSALADGARWTILESSGAVNVAAPMGAPHLASTSEVLAPGATLTTGGTGRAILKNGAQQIVIGPNSRMSLPSGDSGGMTHILQDLGTLLFKVDKRPEQHFSVETPFIAAIVKGTTFTVTAGPMSHSVHVVEGLVEVGTPNGNSHQFVRPGMTAIVSRSNPAVIDVTGANAPSATPINEVVPQGTESAAPTLLDASAPASVSPAATVTTKSESTFEVAPGTLDMTALTDGLIQSTPAQTTSATSASAAAASVTADTGGSKATETSSSGRTVTVEVGGGVASAGGQANVAGASEAKVGSTVSTAVTPVATIANPGITGVETSLSNVVGGGPAAVGNTGGSTVSTAANAGGNAFGNTLSTVTTTLGAATGNGNGNGNSNGASIASVVNTVLGADPAGAGASNGNGNALGAANSVLTPADTATSGVPNGNGGSPDATLNATVAGNSGSNAGASGNGNSGSSSEGLGGSITGSNGNSNGNGLDGGVTESKDKGSDKSKSKKDGGG